MAAAVNFRVPFNVLNRRIHYWVSATVALPVLVIISTGLLLQAKKQWAFVQPPEKRGTGTEPVISLHHMLESIKTRTELGVTGWDDVNRLDVRPDRGMVKAWLRNGYEVQVDLGTGHVLQVAYRRSDLIESIHDGSFFAGDWTKLGLFLPSGIALLALWVTGLRMFWVPFAAKRRRAAATRTMLRQRATS
jgi:hypothetical protein